MQKYWDCATFKQREPNTFFSLGNQFLNELKINIKELTNLLSNFQFALSQIYLIDICCQSKIVYAEQLYLSGSKLKNYLDQYLEQVEGIIQKKGNFQEEQQKQVATLFIEIIETAKLSIHDWQQFNQQNIQLDLFQQEIDKISQVYKISSKKENNECQIS